MADLEMDYQTYVAPRYELRRPDEFPETKRRKDPPNVRHLVGVGRPALVRPKRRAMDMAVALLLKTQMPKWAVVAERKNKAPDPDELAVLERNVLVMAKHVGLLGTILIQRILKSSVATLRLNMNRYWIGSSLHEEFK